MENKKIGILTFEQYLGRRGIGSSRIRGRDVVKNWPEAELFRQGQKYDVVIYQKAYWPEHAREFKGIKILDICDPDFLSWQYQTKEMMEEVDAITTSTKRLAEVTSRFTDKIVKYVPDRIDLEFHKGRKVHFGRAKCVVWFGYSSGFEMIRSVLHFLKKLELNLIIISDKAFILPSSYHDFIELKNFPWNENTAIEDILTGDIVVNPKSKVGKWQFKSNNKTLSAWALGMPVAHNVTELERFLDPEERQKEAKLRLKEIEEKWDVKISVQEYKDLIKEIHDKRENNS